MSRRVALIGLLVIAFAARAQTPEPPPEPPPEAGEGDYTLEAADSLESDPTGAEALEFTVGASSDGGSRVRRTQRVSFRGGGTRGTLREGEDALSGGRVAAPLGRGTLTAGRLAPRWGRGLVLGGASEPWARNAIDRGERASYRGRAGEGLSYAGMHTALLVGRFDRAPLAGVRFRSDAFAAGAVVAHDQAQWTLTREDDDRSLEVAFARAGAWRAEGTASGDAGANRIQLAVRAGTRGFRPLAEPRRAGPPHAATLSLTREDGPLTSRILGSMWRWAGGRSGARGALEVTARMRQHGSFASGLEEQHGARREPASNTRPSGTRQGLWTEWRGGPPGARLALRHELWGARAFARDAVRRALVARVERDLPMGGRVAVTHAIWRVRRGESLYLPEPEADRLVLRALAGTGTRSRAELTIPFATGDIRLGLVWVTGGTRAGTRPPAWTVEWTRRSRTARSRGPDASGGGHEVRTADGTPDDRGVVQHARAR